MTPDHPRYTEFIAWTTQIDVPPSEEWWLVFLDDHHEPEDRSDWKPRRKGRACRHGCGARFYNLHTLAEHEAVPHEQCTVCKGFFRDLVRHQMASQRRSTTSRCWTKLKVNR